MLCFLVTSVLRFVPLPYYRRYRTSLTTETILPVPRVFKRCKNERLVKGYWISGMFVINLMLPWLSTLLIMNVNWSRTIFCEWILVIKIYQFKSVSPKFLFGQNPLDFFLNEFWYIEDRNVKNNFSVGLLYSSSRMIPQHC